PRTTARICKVSKYQIAHPSQRKTGSHRSKWENADAKKQGGKKKNLCPRQYAYCCLRAGGQERSQAWREGVHRRDQAAGWSAARSRVAGRSGWCNAADVIATRGAHGGQRAAFDPTSTRAYLAVALAAGLLFLAGATFYELMWPRPVVPLSQMSP